MVCPQSVHPSLPLLEPENGPKVGGAVEPVLEAPKLWVLTGVKLLSDTKPEWAHSVDKLPECASYLPLHVHRIDIQGNLPSHNYRETPY